MRRIKKCVVLLILVCALSAIGAANASATFTYSATGSLHGHPETTQVFNTGTGEVACTGATVTGAIVSTNASELELTTHYSGCKAFGIVGVHISTATYLFTTSGEVHVLEPITITVTKTLFTAHCTVTVPAQTLNKVDYATTGTAGSTHVTITSTITGIHSTGTGGVCNGTNTNGTYTGAKTIARVGGGWIEFDG